MASLAQLKKEHPWPFGDKATCLARIRPGNQNLETPRVISLRNGVSIRKEQGWHRITQDSYPILAAKVTDGGTPVVSFREDPVAKSMKQLSKEAQARKPRAAKQELHPAIAAAQEGLEESDALDPEEAQDLVEDDDEEEAEEDTPSRLSTADFDEDLPPPAPRKKKAAAKKKKAPAKGRRRRVTLKKE